MPIAVLSAAQRAEWERFPEEIDDGALDAFLVFSDDELAIFLRGAPRGCASRWPPKSPPFGGWASSQLIWPSCPRRPRHGSASSSG
jgi:hypothetical protein